MPFQESLQYVRSVDFAGHMRYTAMTQTLGIKGQNCGQDLPPTYSINLAFPFTNCRLLFPCLQNENVWPDDFSLPDQTLDYVISFGIRLYL